MMSVKSSDTFNQINLWIFYPVFVFFVAYYCYIMDGELMFRVTLYHLLQTKIVDLSRENEFGEIC